MFNGEYYKQISGTAMGIKIVPSYTNIFMGRLERNQSLSVPYKPLRWLRFIDDIEMKWVKTLNDFVIFANSFHYLIKFSSQLNNLGSYLQNIGQHVVSHSQLHLVSYQLQDLLYAIHWIGETNYLRRRINSHSSTSSTSSRDQKNQGARRVAAVL